MSQKKVDAYKKEKANRKKAIEAAKKKNMIYKVVAGIVTLIVVVWLVCSIGWRYLDWYNPFAPKETTRILSSEELSSVRDALGLDSNGNPKTTTAAQNTTAGKDDSTTTAAKDDSTTLAEENTTPAE